MSTDDERYAPFPLTDTQRAYLLGRGDMFALGNVSTHAYFEFDGDLDPERFATAWRLLVERHDMLRAVMLPDSMEQRVLPDAPPFVPDVVDLRRLSVAAREAELAALRERLSHEVRPADRWPLFGVTVARLRDDLVRVFIGFDGLVCDFASWHVLSGELSRLYTDPGAVLEPLSGSFREYVLAERALRDGEEYREAEAYWHKRIAELPPPPRLPLAADPGQLARSRFVRREAELPRADWARLTARARSAGLTPSALLLAVFSEVLAAWSEEARFTVNVPRMNRLPLLARVERLVGEFASFSLVEVDNRARDTFEERALRIQRRLWEDLSHHQVSGAWMLRELARLHNSMDRARMPVVLTSTLAWADPEGTALDRIWTQVHGVSQTPQVFLDVQLDERQGRLVYNWDSVDELFPAGMPEAMFEAFRALLERLAHSRWRSTGLEVLPPDQRARREAVRGRPRELPAVPAHAAFLRRAAEDPGRTAVVTSAGELGYGRLARRAAGVASLLTDGGRGPGPVVGVLLDKGQEQVVAVYGALLAGAAYLPLDPAMPEVRRRAVLADAGVDTVLVRGGGPHGGLPAGVRAVAVDGELPDVPVPVVEELPQGPGDLLYVLFTSGSTGTPKGVMVEHAGMVNALRETEETFGVGPDDTVLGLTALHHDMSAFDLFGVLGAGGTLVLPDPGAERDPAHWAELLRRHRVTLWNSVPAMLEMMLDDPGAAGALASLRLAFTGGDWIPPELVRSLAELAPKARLVGVGGPSETTLWNIWHPVDALDPAVPGVPYGKPIANTAYHLLDERLRDRPDGVTGEMYVSGVGLARGYWRDTERTAAAFLVHPDTGERLYRTGDLGRYLPDGALEFVGRADLQLKVRGQRIEPAEVEAALALHPGVARAVVTGVPADGGRRGYKALAAHVLGSGGGPDPRELRARLRERLPEHMVPAAFLRVTAFPLTANGKVDRAALTEAAGRAARPPAGLPQPAGPAGGPLELLLAEEWSRALGVDGVGPDEDFFALGGDSLLGARILTRLRGIFAGERLTARTLFETLTVTGMAEALRGAESAPGRLDLVARLHRTVSALSPEQTAAALDELGRS